MNVFNKTAISLAISMVFLSACSTEEQKLTDNKVDLLITNGTVYTGESNQAQQLDVAICQQVICGLYVTGEHSIKAERIIDAKNKIVSPGFYLY